MMKGVFSSLKSKGVFQMIDFVISQTTFGSCCFLFGFAVALIIQNWPRG